jgi:uncharacterized protein (DUF427 family)
MAQAPAQEQGRRERDPNHKVRVEPIAKWIRGVFGGQTIVDTKRALILFETGHTPVYYFHKDDVRMDLMQPTEKGTNCPYKGDASYWTITVGDKVSEDALWGYPDPYSDAPDIKDYVAFYWNKVDHWFEEEEEVYVHARDPYKRVDTMPSSRHVQVVMNGETVADTHTPTLLFETGLPIRYYIPKTDIRMDLLTPTDKVTRCPYKGASNYYSVTVGGDEAENIAWYYTYPIPESAKISGLVAFFNERADIYVDGELMEKPKTKWSAARPVGI